MTWTLVTGSAKRTGAVIAQALAKAGFDVVIHYRHSREEAEATKKLCEAFGGRVGLIQGNLDESFAERYMQEFPETENIVHNVGDYILNNLLDTTPDEWTQLLNTNLFAPLTLNRICLPAIKKHQGSIIHLGTAGLNSQHYDKHAPAYSIIKDSLFAATKILAAQFAPDHVRVNMVSPGCLDNSINLEKTLPHLPMQRAGTPQEVADAILFLLNQPYITGQNIEIAGAARL